MNSLDARVLVTIILALGLIFAYQELVLKRLAPPPQEQAAGTASPRPPLGSPAIAPSPAPAQSAPAAAAAETPASLPAAQASAAPPRTVEVDTDLYDAVITTRGARLISFRLKKYRETATLTSPPYEMVKPGPNGTLPLGLVVNHGDTLMTDAALDYTTGAPVRLTTSPGHPVTVSFTARTRDGLAVTKTFTFRAHSYVFDLKAAFAGKSEGVQQAGFTISQPLSARAGYADIPELQADVKGSVMTEAEKALRQGVEPVAGEITYAGFGDRYFLSVYLPQAPAAGTLAMNFSGEEAHARLLFDRALELTTAVYMGPKQIDVLEAVSPALGKAINFGMFGIIAMPFLRALKLFYRIAPNYGVAIILLTVVVRLLTLPMSIKGQRSMMRMQQLQPQVLKIREKFKDDQERLNREMVDLYKRNHVNPLGGCLPMLIQLPILYGLYEALLNAVELRQAPFIGWIKDLSAPDCLTLPGMPALPLTSCHGIPVLVILLAVTALIQQWMSPRQPDPNQQKMMMYMPVMFSLIFIEFPAGLSLYYLASNLLGIIQQAFLNYEFKQYAPATTT